MGSNSGDGKYVLWNQDACVRLCHTYSVTLHKLLKSSVPFSHLVYKMCIIIVLWWWLNELIHVKHLEERLALTSVWCIVITFHNTCWWMFWGSQGVFKGRDSITKELRSYWERIRWNIGNLHYLHYFQNKSSRTRLLIFVPDFTIPRQHCNHWSI